MGSEDQAVKRCDECNQRPEDGCLFNCVTSERNALRAVLHKVQNAIEDFDDHNINADEAVATIRSALR